ncbi:MAG: DUF3473 domain-containing protein [Gemmatimonadaceae bacterium]|nr:DUF3473 domain-containing protein [Gemmatimonadaceae bacterium]
MQQLPASLTPTLPTTTAHLFTVDVEEHFQVSSFENHVPRSSWDGQPSRVARNVEILLDLLARHDSRGTFFTLGWVAAKHPDVVRRIASAGHEVASHGWWHTRVTMTTPDAFREDVRSSKRLLEDLCGQPVIGYRAPSFSIVPGREWALDTLIEEGYRYDSSLFPIHRSGYGYPGAPAVPHLIRRPSGTLYELPPATTMLAGMRIPAAGGGYLRQFPFALIRRAFRQHADRGIPGMFYIHPWEVDPGQPRIAVPFLTRVRHYRGLTRSLPAMERLLDEFKFTSVAERFAGFADPAIGSAWPFAPA